MRWIIDPHVADGAPKGVAWLKEYLGRHDLHNLDWTRIDLGRGSFAGAYGRCWFPVGRRKGFRISIQVPGPFPFDIKVRRAPIYLLGGRSRELLPGEQEGEHVVSMRGGVPKAWIRVVAHARLETMDEAVVWVGAHEAFHFLRRTRQIPGRNVEIEADAHADRMLASFRGDAAGSLKGIWSWMTKKQAAAILAEHA